MRLYELRVTIPEHVERQNYSAWAVNYDRAVRNVWLKYFSAYGQPNLKNPVFANSIFQVVRVH